jgi:hypothetical protein
VKRALLIAAMLASSRAVADPPSCHVAAGYASLSFWEGAFRARYPYGTIGPNGGFSFGEMTTVDEAHLERVELGMELQYCRHDEPGPSLRLGVEANRIGFSSADAADGFHLEVNAPISPGWRVGVRGAYLPFDRLQSEAPLVVGGVRARYRFGILDLAVTHESAGNYYVPPGFDQSTWGFFVGVGVDVFEIARL